MKFFHEAQLDLCNSYKKKRVHLGSVDTILSQLGPMRVVAPLLLSE